MDRRERARLLAPNALTAANIAVGFVSILAAADGRFELSVYLILLAIVLDLFDGRVARWLRATSKFGQEMDSLSDALSFCAAPAFLAQRAILQPLGGGGIAVSLAFLLAGVLRLARFNLTSEVHSKASRTLGVPTPIAAGYVMVLVLMRDRVPVEVGAAVVVAMALLMVSRVRLPEMKGRDRVTYSLLVGMGNYFAVMIWPNWYTVSWWNIWNLVILLLDRAGHRRVEGLRRPS